MFYKNIDYEECNDGYILLLWRFFPTSYKCIKYDCNRYSISEDGFVMAKAGYWWNGANIVIDTPNSMASSCLHDILYDMLRKDIIPNTYGNRRKADKMFYNELRADGMSYVRANAWYWGVRFGGWKSV